MNNFKIIINKLMHEKNVTQKILAEELGITQATLSRNLNGIHMPKAEIIEKMASYFNVSTDYLLGKSDVRNPKFTNTTFALGGLEQDLTDKDKETIMNLAQMLADKNKD